MQVIFLDTETTGFGDCRMVELAYMPEGGQWTSLRCKPPIAIEEGATKIHGITDEMLDGLPAFMDRPEYGEIKKMLETNVVVAHNASFDIAVLAREGVVPTLVLDTLAIARKLYPHVVNHKLQTLRDYFHIEGGAAHSAGGDVLTLAGLFAQIRTDVESTGVLPEDVLSILARA